MDMVIDDDVPLRGDLQMPLIPDHRAAGPKPLAVFHAEPSGYAHHAQKLNTGNQLPGLLLADLELFDLLLLPLQVTDQLLLFKNRQLAAHAVDLFGHQPGVRNLIVSVEHFLQKGNHFPVQAFHRQADLLGIVIGKQQGIDHHTHAHTDDGIPQPSQRPGQHRANILRGTQNDHHQHRQRGRIGNMQAVINHDHQHHRDTRGHNMVNGKLKQQHPHRQAKGGTDHLGHTGIHRFPERRLHRGNGAQHGHRQIGIGGKIGINDKHGDHHRHDRLDSPHSDVEPGPFFHHLHCITPL